MVNRLRPKIDGTDSDSVQMLDCLAAQEFAANLLMRGSLLLEQGHPASRVREAHCNHRTRGSSPDHHVLNVFTRGAHRGLLRATQSLAGLKP